ncbi:hypothetical protein P7K49_014463 [Saguinus oedipus]|uniref:Olduvai domain-containing protein n=1 Tax=Saguinus oedipus TaxID=9490 RepID=A0ABQ9VL48_SAGOE|nr:hypothetical protein P7K49_014463 [Saguinus oedipus]
MLHEEFSQIEELRQFKALTHYQTQQLAKLKHESQKVRDASCSLNQHFKVHLTPDDADKSQHQSHQEQLAKRPRLAEHYVSKLNPENDKNHEDHTEEVKKSRPNSLVQTHAVLPTFPVVQSQNQDPKLVLSPSIVIKNPPQMEDDTLEGSADNTQGDQVPLNIHASSVPKPKKIKRKLPFSKWIHWPSHCGCRDCDNHKYVITSLEEDILLIGEETLHEEFSQIEELRQYKALANYQTEQLAKLKHELQKVRDASCSLNQRFKVHLTSDGSDKSQHQSHQEQLAKGPRLAEHYVSKLSPENDKNHEDHTEEEVEKVEKSAASRLSQELPEKKNRKPQKTPWMKFTGFLQFRMICLIATSLIPVPHPHCFTVNVDSDSTLLPYGFLHPQSRPSSLAQTHAVLPTFPVVQSQNQDPKLVLSPSIVIKNPPQMEDDTLEGPANNTQGDQVPLNIHASSVPKPKKIKRKLPFGKHLADWEETLHEEFSQIEELRQYKPLAHYQTEQLAKLKHELQKVRDASCSLSQRFKVQFTFDDPDKSQRQNLQEQLGKGLRLAEYYVSKLSPGNDNDDEDHTEKEVKKVEKSAPLRLSQELLEAKEQKAPEDSLDEIYWTLSIQGDLSDCHQPYSSASFSLENQLTCPALDIAYSIQATCPQGTWNGNLSYHLSDVHVSKTQLEPSTLAPSCL